MLKCTLSCDAGDADKGSNPVATLLPADLHPCFVQRLWDQAQSMSDSVLLDTVVSCCNAVPSNTAQSSRQKMTCTHLGRAIMACCAAMEQHATAVQQAAAAA